jgi:SAM-dependent methyltransferase
MSTALTNHAIVLPRSRTWRRWYRIARSPYSLLRTLQYEAIEGLHLSGRVLDIGGQAHSDYYGLLRIDGTLERVNIDEGSKPDYLHDLNTPLPIADATFDHVISLNTFEHLREDSFALSELIRVLKLGGSFHILVPFCYRVHRSPSDYHRHTSFWWRDQLLGLGVQADRLRIEPLAWDQRATGFSFVLVRGWVRAVVLLRGLVMPGPAIRYALRTLRGRSDRLTQYQRERLAQRTEAGDFAVGYYISGLK